MKFIFNCIFVPKEGWNSDDIHIILDHSCTVSYFIYVFYISIHASLYTNDVHVTVHHGIVGMQLSQVKLTVFSSEF